MRCWIWARMAGAVQNGRWSTASSITTHRRAGPGGVQDLLALHAQFNEPGGGGGLGWELGIEVEGVVVDLCGVRGEVAGMDEAAGEFEDDVQRLVGQVVQGDVVFVDAEEVGELPGGHARVVLAAA